MAADPLPSRLFGGFTMHKVCLECGHGVPMNGPHDGFGCDYCGAVADVAANLDAALERFWTDEYGLRACGRGYTFGHGGMMTVSGFVEYKQGEPRCHGCDAPLPLVAPGTDATLLCKACGSQYETFPPPPALVARHPHLLQCYCADRSGDSILATQSDPAARPESSGEAKDAGSVLLDCPRCGAAFAVTTATPRASACEYCKTHLYLPDAVWEHLHPVRVKRRWYAEMAPQQGRAAGVAAGARGGEGPDSGGSTGAGDLEERPAPIDEDREVFLAQRRWLEELGALEPKGSGIFGLFRLSVACPTCGSPVPVNGPVRAAHCGKCFTVVDVAARVGGWIREFEFGPCAMDERSCTYGGTGLNGKAFYQVSRPKCPKCGEALARVETGFEGAVTCSACGRSYPTFAPPRWLRDHALSAAQCYLCEPDIDPMGGDKAQAQALEASAASKDEAPVAFQCLGCGATMELRHGSARICGCPYCGRTMHVPDAVWYRLYPPREERDWYLELGGPLVTSKGEATRISKEVEREIHERYNREALLIHERRERRLRMARIRRQAVHVGIFIAVAALAALAWFLWF